MDVQANEIINLIDCDDQHREQQLVSLVATEPVWLAVLQTRPEQRRTVTLNKHLPDSILIRLAQDDDANVRIDIAMKRRLPESLFDMLANDTDEAVRERIAFNAKTPFRVLQRLSSDPSPRVSSIASRRLAQKKE